VAQKTLPVFFDPLFHYINREIERIYRLLEIGGTVYKNGRFIKDSAEIADAIEELDKEASC
jgi:hypothetical protein